MSHRQYASPEAFKKALEQRLKDRGGDLSRHRRLLVFERFLARVMAAFGDVVTLKGGLGLELRLARARSTRDIDLRMEGAPTELLARLQRAATRDLGDFMAFEVLADAKHPTITGEGVRYDGLRFTVRCTLARKDYGGSFGLDVAFADPILGEPDEITTPDTLAFAGIAPTVLRVYPIETHLAEKLHAYTLPRTRPNSRVKDLPDLALLASIGRLQAERVRAAVQQTFTFRATHPPPASLPDPPEAWALPYARLAAENSLPWSSLAAVTAAARDFLDPVLGGHDGQWSSERWAWL